MKVNLISQPVSNISGDITVASDKSISHRAIIFGALASGQSLIEDILTGEDCFATIAAFRQMGVNIEFISNNSIIINGVGLSGLHAPAQIIDCGNSGTSMRLLAGLLVGQSFDSILDGDASLRLRPMSRITKPLQAMGANVNAKNDKAPLYIYGNRKLSAINYELPTAGAQVKSCLILAGLYAHGQTQITEPVVTRDHTERMLQTFQYPFKKDGQKILINSGNQLKPTKLIVPKDISSAAFFIVAATIIPGSELYIRNVGINPTRTGILSILQLMGAKIELQNHRFLGAEPVCDILVKHSKLAGIQVPNELISLAIDEIPILSVAAAFATGETVITGAAELRVKESDRIKAMAEALTILGIKVFEHPDGLTIIGGKVSGGIVDSHHDHRIAMSCAIAGTCATSEVKILNTANIATSFPNFVKLANSTQMQLLEI